MLVTLRALPLRGTHDNKPQIRTDRILHLRLGSCGCRLENYTFLISTHVHAFKFFGTHLYGEMTAGQIQEFGLNRLLLYYVIVKVPLDPFQDVLLEIILLDINNDFSCLPSRQWCSCIRRWKHSVVRGFLKQSDDADVCPSDSRIWRVAPSAMVISYVFPFKGFFIAPNSRCRRTRCPS